MAKIDKAQRDKEIRAAIEAVAETGEDPTNDLVRAQLGGRGSYSTISPVVRAWKAERAAQPLQPANNDNAEQQTEVPAVIQQTLIQVNGLLKQLEVSVPSQIDAAVNNERRRGRAELDAERETFNKQLQSLRADIAAQLNSIKSLEEEGQRFEDLIDDLKTKIVDQESAHEKDLQAQQARSDEHLAVARADHQREIAQMAKQIEEMKTTLGNQKSVHANELKDQQARSDERLDEVRADHVTAVDRLIKEHNDRLAELRQHNEALEREKQCLAQSQANALAAQQARFDEQIAGTRADLQDSVDRLSRQIDQMTKDHATRLDELRQDHQANAKHLEQVLADLRQRLDGSEETRRELERTIIELTQARKPED